jgi:hypothetical protein
MKWWNDNREAPPPGFNRALEWIGTLGLLALAVTLILWLTGIAGQRQAPESPEQTTESVRR